MRILKKGDEVRIVKHHFKDLVGQTGYIRHVGQGRRDRQFKVKIGKYYFDCAFDELELVSRITLV